VPELPDLEYMLKELSPRLSGRRIVEVAVKEPIVIRMLVSGSFAESLKGRTFEGLMRRGPFLTFSLGGRDAGAGAAAAGEAARKGPLELIIHHMLSGRLQLSRKSAKPLAHLCFSLLLDDDSCLRYGDDTRMGKVYVTAAGAHAGIPGYDTQGIDILSDEFTYPVFETLIKGRRHQVRVFLMDQSALSAIGNAYTDEILFAAGIHPKTPCASLAEEERGKLYASLRSVIAWGISEVEKAQKPTEVKVREHMKVRNRKGEPCPACGATIRTVGVLGYDSFFCPRCQPGPWTGKAGGTASERGELQGGKDAGRRPSKRGQNIPW
jgi:formamidopyrimidine-DNA glycosylase